MKNAYKYMRETLLKEKQGVQNQEYDYKNAMRTKLVEWRRASKVVELIDKPSNLTAARSLGYKAKEGVEVARVRVRKGIGMHSLPTRGRKPKKYGRMRRTRVKSIQSLAEERCARRFPLMEVLNSYWAGEDGNYKYYEVILVDPFHPSIASDKDLNWIVNAQHTGRVFRGKTSSGKKSRGLMYKGKGVEKARPSIRAHQRKQR